VMQNKRRTHSICVTGQRCVAVQVLLGVFPTRWTTTLLHQTSTCLTQLSLEPYVVQIWSRTPRISAGSKHSNSTVCSPRQETPSIRSGSPKRASRPHFTASQDFCAKVNSPQKLSTSEFIVAQWATLCGSALQTTPRRL